MARPMTPSPMRATTAILAISVLAFACARPLPTPTAPSTPPPTAEEVATDTRVNAYFKDTVATPKLRACWNALAKDALVVLEFHYRKSAATWQFASVDPLASTLAKDQQQAAAACVAEAARGTSFPVDAKIEREAAATTLVLRWEWQVPLPSSAEEVAARATTTGPRGPDLPVPPAPVCKSCSKHLGGDIPYKCETVKSGKADCEIRPDRVCVDGPEACSSGRFGMSGGVIMY